GGFERKVNVFLCYEIISRLAQRTFSSFENFYVLPKSFSGREKTFTHCPTHFLFMRNFLRLELT
ncbi:hypothetical protein, partial [uncultured Treponema sp.]|uniref:hypothetical protein n=1 Tax=uncultured Treponema sp. TaxID=162155 RepID=UPI00263480D0